MENSWARVEKMILSRNNRIRSISLKWKLLLPFLFFAFTGTTTLTIIGLASQQRLIKEEEKKTIQHFYHHFLERIRLKESQALSLATLIATDRDIQEKLALRDREGLRDLLAQTYLQLKEKYNIQQFHFHIPPGSSFFRVHDPELYGDDLRPIRKMVTDVLSKGVSLSGVEQGATGLGIRGVVPVFRNGDIVGSVEIGLGFGRSFLLEFREQWGVDVALYIKKGDAYQFLESAGDTERRRFDRAVPSFSEQEETKILIAPKDYPDRSILLGSVKDYSGKNLAIVALGLDRSQILHKLRHTRNIMILVGSAGLALSFLLTYLVVSLFIRPIKEIVKEAQDIAEERREYRLESRPNDEIGRLSEALNVLLDSLKKRRLEVEDYAKTLEQKVQERTVDLEASEEKYRTLVENVPLIVYRIRQDGTTEFVNYYLKESLGYSIEEVMGDRLFWREKITGPSEKDNFYKACFEEGDELRVERTVKDHKGRSVSFIDHAIPAWDANGRVRWVDGIMMDISELKRLQERALRTEEIKLLGEISARMAHEIRNPLSTAGGFARRLRDSIPEDSPNYRLVQIIVEEVARLEHFLKVLFTSIRPFDLSLGEINLNDMLKKILQGYTYLLDLRRITAETAFAQSFPVVQGDQEKLSQAFSGLIEHAILSTPEGERIAVTTEALDDTIVITLMHKIPRLSVDDLEKFFFPHVEDKVETTVLDLPLSKVIIHRHGGKIDLWQEEDKTLVMKIEFPY
jgi:PAS domain S-box-containing protein